MKLNNKLILLLYLPIIASSFSISNVLIIIEPISLLIMWMYIIKNDKYDKYSISIIFFILYTFLNTGYNMTYSVGIVYATFKLMSVSLFTLAISKSYESLKSLVAAMLIIFEVGITINFLVTVILDSDIRILGGKNAIQMFAIPTLFFLLLKKDFFNNKYNFFDKVVFITMILNLLYVKSSTGLIICFLILLYLTKFINRIPLKIWLIIYSFLFFLIILLRKVTFLSYIIHNIFEKDLTFSGRTYIWDFVIQKIIERPMVGYGRGNSIISNYFFNIIETHNGFLEILFLFGVIGLAMFLVILFFVIKEIGLMKRKRVTNSIGFILFLYFILGLTESVFLKIEFWIYLSVILGMRKGMEEVVEDVNCIYTDL